MEMESSSTGPHPKRASQRQCGIRALKIVLGVPILIWLVLCFRNQYIILRSIGEEMSNNHVANDESQLCSQCNEPEVARRESLGFFDDIPLRTWKRMKKKVKDMSPNFNPFYLPYEEGAANKDQGINKWIPEGIKQPGLFYQNNYEPDFVCQHEQRIGRLGDGGKWVCDPHRISEQKDCLVYSVGSNNDFSFEKAVLEDIGQHCEIHTFDFGDYREGARQVGKRTHNGEVKDAVTYHQFGLGEDNPPKFKSLATVVNELGHNNRTVDIFKIDCEGCEWETAKHWFEADVTLRQIQVELHQSHPINTPKFFDMMYENNYVITHKESNIQWTGPKDVCIEYAFLKLSPEFFAGYDRLKGSSEYTDRLKGGSDRQGSVLGVREKMWKARGS